MNKLSKEELSDFYKKYIVISPSISMSEFCRQEEIGYDQFRNYKYRAENFRPRSGALAPVVLSSECIESSNSNNQLPKHISSPGYHSKESIVIKYPNGVLVEISTNNISTVSTLVNIPIL